jgi:uroporphyrinogen-III synthase
MSINVLITRPGENGLALGKNLEMLNVSSNYLPLIKIYPCSVDPLLKEHYDIVVFVSPNAVIYGNKLPKAVLAKAQIAVVGKGSLKQLTLQNIKVDIAPDSHFTSEGLLALPELQVIKGKTILIVRGKGGREKLRNSLLERGAEVDYLEVYQRKNIHYVLSDLEVLKQKKISIIQVSNQESLDRLIPLVNKASWFASCQWWLLSERTKNSCIQYGIKEPLCHVISPGNDAFLTKIKDEL